MGQQQLLLVILVTIIVGIATVVAINIFGTAAEQANRDAVRQDLLSAGAQAQALWARPGMMGGISQDFTNVDDIRDLNIPRGSSADDDYTEDLIQNDNADYTIVGATATTITIHAVPASGTENITLEIQRVGTAPDTRWEFVWDGETITGAI